MIFKKSEKANSKKEKANKPDKEMQQKKIKDSASTIIPPEVDGAKKSPSTETKKSQQANTTTVAATADKTRVTYINCPRCELNYISSADKYCNVCKAEMGLVDRSILLPDIEEAGIEQLCPICNLNYLNEDEDICFLCAKEKFDKSDRSDGIEEDWSKDITDSDSMPEEEMEISLTELEEQEEDDNDDIKNIDDEFEYVNPDETDESDYEDEDID